ncbi:diaminopimelate decarboxylase [Thermosipho melanesiensis]|uniref:Diaminopimelate decarboxylase n=2 Tax=Thermosipho melanesiensis TaxID=46541 RepID=A6LLV3_THEM4|nr:diaminopimelate decarboxylase [Thermosipho melanesiensis]ABR30904.1 diaminopimelate decarboxylase [Thermosipho melanesiensis BI429]APT74023.1 diaminopimelate decarboxylase [Thermosipho melanesiensis]OOC35951.1 diaminopimelate decarboxylase [Thermosipho melanesiensis]OOC38453.1 diaminopimelate decarboxylase [Thermosipho melanesiensis]OOC38914.1 diaminopimelate decarboxylase [Thermosipho melanesiensis]
MTEIMGKYETPFYLYFEKTLIERISMVKDVFKEANIFPTFAVKANNNPHLLKIIAKNGFGMDILGEGELHACKLANIPGEKIIWNGNGKTEKQKKVMKEYGVNYVNIDSKEEFDLLWKTEESFNLFLRVNPDIDAKTHPYISTGLKSHKFGVSFNVAKDILKSGKITGLHLHIGSQITDVEPFKEAIEKTLELAKKYNIKHINIGGGWGISYNEEKELDLEKYKKEVIPFLSEFDMVINEIGRFIIAPAGVLVTKVILVKETENKTFVVVESGMNHLIRPALYNAYHEIEVLNNSLEYIKADIVGPLCETGDFLAKDRKIKKVNTNDILIIKNTGAYGYSMSNNYNGTTRPAEVLVTVDGKDILIRRKETIDDLFRNITKTG